MGSSPTTPLVTIAVPSFNQGRFLDAALSSIFQQQVPEEVFAIDGGRVFPGLAARPLSGLNSSLQEAGQLWWQREAGLLAFEFETQGV